MKNTLTNQLCGVKFNQTKTERGVFMKYCEILDWACNMLKMISENDFNKGFATGVCFVIAVILLMFIVRIIFKLIFRRRRCHEICTKAGDGDVSVTVSAIEDTIREELKAFPSISIIKIRLYRVRKNYMLNLICEYDGKDGGLPQITQKVKSSLSEMFSNFFGINSIRKINIKFERLAQDKNVIVPTPAEETTEPVSDDINN